MFKFRFAGQASVVAATWIVLGVPAFAQADPLPSWNDGAAKTAIVAFVDKVTDHASADFVQPQDRIATFDNDGTLWTEQPVYTQLLFAFDRIRAMAKDHPEWATQEPYKSVIAGDMKGLEALGEKGLVQIIATTHAGMTTDEFHQIVADWIATAKSPKFDRPYTQLVYQPMLELMDYLRDKDFKTFIVSGGGVEFMRPWSEATYGIPPEQVVGSSGKVTFELDAQGKARLVKQADVEFVDDGAGKPVGINRFIGHRPILAVGNSDGDLQMLQYVASGDGPHFVAFVHHDDDTREVAYDRTSAIGKLDKGLDAAAAGDWLVVSMKDDWKSVFPPAP